mmetsp:Transcript_13143/g.30481  ORF Transcript_13143/g.30481 Transcript_13143/m.30481 type:complete len:171 (+) Transcript_13143:37-549(+)
MIHLTLPTLQTPNAAPQPARPSIRHDESPSGSHKLEIYDPRNALGPLSDSHQHRESASSGPAARGMSALASEDRDASHKTPRTERLTSSAATEPSVSPSTIQIEPKPAITRLDLSDLKPAIHLSWGDHNVTSTLAQPLSPEQLSQAAADAKRIRGQKATSFMLLRAAAPF